MLYSPAFSIIGRSQDSMRKLMPKDDKKQTQKDKPNFVPKPSIFEQRTGQKGANNSSSAPKENKRRDMQELLKSIKELRNTLKDK